MGILSKIKVGRKSDRNFFDLSHDVNTTSDFGFCQPTLIQNIVADSKINLKTSSFVRLAPLPVPTFGRINVKQHTAFVPYRDVFLAYDNFQSGKPVQSAVRHYTPYKADNISNSNLFSFLMNISRIEAGYGSLDTIKNNLYFKVNAFVKTSVAPEDRIDRDGFYDPLNSKDDFDYLDENRFYNMVAIYSKLFNDPEGGQRSLFNQLFYDTFHHFYNYLDENYVGANSGKFNWLNFIDVQLWRDYEGWIEARSAGLKNAFGDYAHRYLHDLPEYEIPFFSESVSIENADFVFHPENVDIELGMMDEGGELVYKHIKDVIFTIKLTPLGRRLFKIFNADGINFGMKEIPCDVLSLYSYYKSWFDKYNPGRNMQWLDTNCYFLIHGYYDFGRTLNDMYIIDSFREGDSTFTTVDYKKHMRDFFSDLANCCYTLPVDNITVATEDLLTNVDDTRTGEVSVVNSYDSGSGISTSQTPGNNSAPYGLVSDVESAGGLGIKLLERIYHLVNKNSVIGSRIDEYLKAHNLGSPLPESLVLGDSDFSVMVEDTYSTAETEQAQLGEFAGKGKQYNDGDFMKFETANAGVLVQFVCIVPYGGYVQSGRKAMVDRYDFYNAFYDSLGKEAMTKYDVLSRVYLLDKVEDDSVYGFVPQYFHHKVRNNLANGGFAFRSEMSQFLPYSLDRIFTVPDLYIDKVRKWSSARHDYVMVDEVRETADLNIQADEYLRYIGRNEGFGNYNRIFYDTTGLTDNFIIQMVHDFKVFSPMKPVSESFDTYDKDVDNGYTDVSHS